MTTTRRTVRKVAKKTAAKKSAAPQRPNPGKNVEVKVEVTIMVSAGPEDTRSIEEIREAIRADLKNPNGQTRAKLVTNMGGYYLVDGRVCLPDDYDPKTRGFKPGAHPPLWAMGPDERAVLARIEKEKGRPALARNPQNLRTAAETDAVKREQRPRTPAEALHDLHENSEWGKKKKAEIAERDRLAKEAAESASASEEEEPYYDEDEFSFDESSFEGEDEEDDPEADDEDEEEEDDFEAEWDEDDPLNDEVADEALEEQTSSALAKLKGGRKKRTVTTVAKPPTKKKVVRRR